ncbi:MAG: gliding motility lipoprotein GldD [Bacteroidia bacterium]|nr:gliding motility lipoprotein GldD [Bacteroidia bacterium]
MVSRLNSIILFVFVLFVSACDEPLIPKPKGYFRIDLPEHAYRAAEFGNCPFRFEIPAYAEILPDTNRLSEPCWWYLVFPGFKAALYISYKPIKDNLYRLIEDAHSLAYSHAVKANEINQRKILIGKNGGLMYEIGGNAASPLQFYVTDSVNHFLRGSLYFNALPNADSVSPVTRFLKTDIEYMVQTLKWN